MGVFELRVVSSADGTVPLKIDLLDREQVPLMDTTVVTTETDATVHTRAQVNAEIRGYRPRRRSRPGVRRHPD